MIKIELEGMQTEGSDELSDATIALVARSVANKVTESTKGIVCKKHPTSQHLIKIRPHKTEIKLEHSEFCCKDFHDKVSKIVMPIIPNGHSSDFIM